MSFITPVPCITESFIDSVIETCGGRRLTESELARISADNSDYSFPGCIAELKIFEDEPLEKEERQKKIAELYRRNYIIEPVFNLDINSVPPALQNEYRAILGTRIRKAVRKSSRQIHDTKRDLDRSLDFGLLIVVNNGFHSLQHGEFDNLVLTYCREDSIEIDYLLSINVEYHQGDFDAYIFCITNGYSVRGDYELPWLENFRKAVGTAFNDRMTYMMRNWKEQYHRGRNLKPVKDICFTGNGVEFIKDKPRVPDSRFETPQ